MEASGNGLAEKFNAHMMKVYESLIDLRKDPEFERFDGPIKGDPNLALFLQSSQKAETEFNFKGKIQ